MGFELSEEEFRVLKRLFEKVAELKGWRLNPDERVQRAIITGLVRNMITYGHMYCPCRLQRTRENICPCVHAEKEIAERGRCHCGLFVRKE